MRSSRKLPCLWPPAAFLFLATGSLQAASVNLAWNASTSPGIVGYKLYYGTRSGAYSASIDVGVATSYTVSNLTSGATHYFAAVGYNSSRAESPYSNEVSYTVAASVPACTYAISPASQAVGASSATGSVGVTAGAGCAWTAASNASWLHVTSGANGTGNGSVGYS